jgi:hypothetical protein
LQKKKRTLRLSAIAASGALAAGVLSLVPATAQADQSTAASGRSAMEADFAAAAAAYHVPASVLKGVANQESGLGTQSGENTGFGPMKLTDVTPQMLQSVGAPAHSDLASATAHPELHTVLTAAKLTGIPADSIRKDPRQNIMAAAALLASYEKQLTGGTPDDPAGWAGAVGRYSGATTEAGASSFTSHVFGTIRSGLHRTASDGGQVDIAANPSAQPATGQLNMLKLATPGPTTPADCPKALDCTFVQASSTGVQVSNRPANGVKIDQIVLHFTEGSYDSAIQTFQGPNAVAAHYVIRASDGAVTQMVSDKDVAFADGNYDSNLRSLNIEMEGFSAHGADWDTDAAITSAAKLVKYLAERYDIPMDSQHILTHDNVPGPNTAGLAGMHWDKGPFFDKTKFMKKIGAPFDDGTSGVGPVGSVVTIAPTFKNNLQTFTISPSDDPTGATPTPTQVTEPSNSLFVHQGPSEDSPLILDPNVHPTATAGTDDVSDWSTTVQAGQQFVVADQQGEWTAIWFDGQKGWIDNPKGKNTIPTTGVNVIKAAGDTAAPVYGTAFPDPSEVPAAWGPDAQNPLTAPNYAIPAGQAYVADQPPVNGQDFFPSRQGVIIGTDQYYVVQFNHRYVYVNADDVTATAN